MRIDMAKAASRAEVKVGRTNSEIRRAEMNEMGEGLEGANKQEQNVAGGIDGRGG